MSHLIAQSSHKTVSFVIAIGNDDNAKLLAGCRLGAQNLWSADESCASARQKRSSN
jgi:hypothetical protein